MSKETKIGLMTAVALAIFIWGFKFLQGKNMFSTSNVYNVEYSNVEGLTTSAKVVINGFQIGFVSDVYLKPDDLSKVIVELDIRRDINIPKTAIAEIITTSFMGEKAVRMNLNGQCGGPDCAKSGSLINGRTVGMLNSMVPKESISEYVDIATSGMGTVMDSLGTTMKDPNSPVAKTMRDVDIILNNLKVTTANMNNMIGSSTGQIKEILNNLYALTKTLNESEAEIKNILNNASAFSSQLKSADIGATLTKANGTIDGASGAIENLQNTLKNAEASLAKVNTIMTKVDSGEGSLGLLVNDKQLYTNLESTSKNLELLLQDFRLNPKRYVQVSVFGGKKKKNASYVKPVDDPAFQGN